MIKKKQDVVSKCQKIWYYYYGDSMASRMERYYKTRDTKRRIIRNEDLYQTIYEDETYSNIEGVVATPKANEIDIEKIRELIASHEHQRAQTRKLVKEPVYEETRAIEEDQKNYDIRDVLSKAKDTRKNPEEEYRNLKNTEYNILKNIKINNKQSIEQEEELKELINTLTNTSLLNKMSDDELSLNMFNDLKSDTMIGNSESIRTILDEAREENVSKTGEMDKSFFTSSLNFKEKDFEKIQDLTKSINKNNKTLKVVLTILFISVAVILLFIIYMLIKK